MQLKFVLTYLIVDYFCLFFSIVIFTKITIDMGTEREVRALRGLIIVFCTYLFVDALWALGSYGILPMSAVLAGVIENFAILLMCGLSYHWFLFAENRIRAPFMENKRNAIIASIPLVVTAVLYATSFFTGLIFQIGPDGTFEEGPAALVPMIVFVFYTGFTAVHALIRCAGEKSRALKRRDLTIAAFVFAPVVCGIIDMLLHGMPVMALAVFAAILLVFITLQGSRINTDVLTGLNNRRRAEEYLEDKISSLSDDARLGVFLIDIDYFKEINDKYGHIEGDHALIIIATGLKQAVGERHGLAARWGGDEFVFATFLDDDETPEEIEKSIRMQVGAAAEQEHLEYALSLSIGHAFARRDEPVSVVMMKADQGLYGQKDEHHMTLESGPTVDEIYPL